MQLCKQGLSVSKALALNCGGGLQPVRAKICSRFAKNWRKVITPLAAGSLADDNPAH
jgi:hypothetical protein